jgi:RNA polymerase sigma factor (sigma-70 family)
LARPQSDAARKRAAVEIVAQHESSLKRTARRYSLDAEDAEDAYQRALEIVLTKAPTTDLRELIRWTQTVTKHEAMAVRESRQRTAGYRAASTRPGDGTDPVALIPATADGPDERAERNEAIARSREALKALKPAELRALTLLAEGYSYAEIGELTGFSQTKINRLLAEGRNRFRSFLSSSEDGSRCRELQPLLSAFCDGEAKPEDAATVREHLRACARCRATMRAYREAPRIAIALSPALPPSRSLLERAHDFLAGLGSRLPGVGGTGDSTAAQVAAVGGARGIGAAGLAKLLAICAGAVGGAACVATGVVPTPLDLSPPHPAGAPIERAAEEPATPTEEEAERNEPTPPPQTTREPKAQSEKPAKVEAAVTETSAAPAGAVEYEAPPAPEPAPAPPITGESASATSGAPSSGSAAGEFGP